MCELFAMSSNRRSSVSYSLNEFARNGSRLRTNRAGWGIAFVEDRDVFLVKEPAPAADSPWAQFVASQNMESNMVIAHIRYATVGANALHNTHPFRRALGKKFHIFAHNGTLNEIHDTQRPAGKSFLPVGDTDSELAFCMLLARLQALWTETPAVPDLKERFDIFCEFAGAMSKLGPANFLYSDGDALFAHAHRRVYEEDGIYSPARPPGLHIKNCATCVAGTEWSCKGMHIELGDHKAVLLASVPLDEHGWESLPECTAIALRGGEVQIRAATS